MYGRRIKIFILLAAFLLLVCLLRLAQMQLLSNSFYRERIAELKQQRGGARVFKTIRGRMLDRNGKVLATDEARFELCMDYRLSSLLDGRVRRTEKPKQLRTSLDNLAEIIQKCARFKGVDPNEIKAEIQGINDSIWSSRAFQAWRRNFPDSPLLKKYGSILSVPLVEALRDFEARVEPPARSKLVNDIDIAEMHIDWPLLDLETDDDVFAAQLEFCDVTGVTILPGAQRTYPYASVAAQTIGWVGPATQQQDKELFEGDRLSRYLTGDVCGREDGAEYVCENVLRGRRGEALYDIDRTIVRRTPTQFGRDVSLTLDIELQQRIERCIADADLNPNSQKPTAAVVIDVATGDILALVSMPTFDLNHIRQNYSSVRDDPCKPLINRAIYKQYPPGSVIKPVILIAALESGVITPDKAISCPAHAAPKGWPSCWIWVRYRSGHDYAGPNIARNAIKQSCNIFFSRLAEMVDADVLQKWLSKFGYGRQAPLASPIVDPNDPLQNESRNHRDFRQVPGIICSANADGKILPGERRWFGIGQGNLRVTPLQVANAFAAIARDGIYKLPHLLLHDQDNSETDSARRGRDGPQDLRVETNLNISPQALETVYDGMGAVVNEPDGTAYNAFARSGFARRSVKVYGKTGSTEQPENAWFGGYAIDGTGRSISVAVVVEGGQHGSSDAGPIAREIIQFCIEAGYLGQAQVTTD